jgi:DNA recombination protein RmuC
VSVVYLIAGLAIGATGAWLWARASIRTERRNADEKLELLQRSEDEWAERIKSVAGDALTTSQRSLLDLADARLKPIKDTLDKFEAEAKKLEEKRAHAVSAVGEQLRAVVEGQDKLRSETGNLVTALRAPHIRGSWGEMQLRRVVELAGMLDHCDFDLQQSTRDDDGKLLRPDLVVRLPGDKTIVVDAKVPIDAYLDAVNADDPEVKRAHLARHAAQMRDHIAKLGQKRYWRQFDSPEFVVMFVDEGLYRAALDQDGSLLESGVENGVIVASPATLIGLLRTVAHGWQQERVAENARQVAELGRELYERIGVFASHFAKVGRSLDTAVAAFNQSVSSFETRLLVTARKFPEHGVTNDELPVLGQIERKPAVTSAPELTALPPADAA